MTLPGRPELAPPTTIRLPRSLLQRLRGFTRPRWKTQTEVIVSAVEEYLERHQDDPLPRP